MNIFSTKIPGVLLIEPIVISDARGFMCESFNKSNFRKLTGVSINFVQENYSKSYNNVLRGLHYQIRYPQGKLIRVVIGEILDVVVDIRRYSETFGHWVSFVLSEEHQRQLWIPVGCAHGFIVRSACATICYKVTNYRVQKYERCILWNDPTININWHITTFPPILSLRDLNGKLLINAEVFS